MIGIIVAVPTKHGATLESLSGGVIGKAGGLPWRHKGDLKRFKEVTDGSAVIMGRRTWESIGSKPLEGRANFVVSSTPDMNPGRGGVVMGTVPAAVGRALEIWPDVWIIGGAGVYAPALEVADVLDVTFVPDEGVEGDVRFPTFDTSRWVAGPVVAHPYNQALSVCAFGRAR